MNSFQRLSTEITEFLLERGIVAPTDIQQRAIPEIMDSQENILLLAPTGMGKTEAALLPLLHHLLQIKEQQGGLLGFYILYVTPLRALNRDVFKRIEGLCKHLGLTISVRHGDTSQYFRRKQSIDPPNVLITTPESLQAILPGKRLRYNLKTVFAVIVDEIHELADGKRGAQLSLALERLERVVGHAVRRIGLSATVGNSQEVACLLGGTKRRTNIIWTGYNTRRADIRVEMPVPTKRDSELSKRLAHPIYSTARLRRIVELIEAHRSTIIFTNTRSFAEILGAKMRLLEPPFEFDVHHGSLSRDIRHAAEDRLKTGSTKAIIATSSLELGIDIGHADLVIQYSSPREVSRGLQRIGRAGHAVGLTSEGVFLVTANVDDITEAGVIRRRAKANKVESVIIPTKAWDVLSHQIAGIMLDVEEIEIADLLEIIQSAYPFRDVAYNELDTLLEFMVSKRIIRKNGDVIQRGSFARQYYYENLSMIPDVRQIVAVDSVTRRSIGVLDEEYVTENVETGTVFIIRGRPYQVVTVEDDEVLCAPITGETSDVPRWIGEMIPVPYEVAIEVAEVWNRIVSEQEKQVRHHLKRQYGLDKAASDLLINTILETKEVLGELPHKSTLIIEDYSGGIVIHAPYGTKTNEALGIVIAALLTTQLGIDIGVERDPYRILLTSSDRVRPEDVVGALKQYDREQVRTILHLAVKNTQTFASRFFHVARRMRIIRKDAKVKEVPIRRLIEAYRDSPVFEEAMNEVLRDKMDEKRAGDIFDGVSRGTIKTVIAKTGSPSPLARLIIEERTRFEVMGEISEEDEILKILEQRLLMKRVRLVCMRGDWESSRTISTLGDTIECPVCKSRMIAVGQISDKSLRSIIKKRTEGKPLSAEEEKKYKRASLSASLVANYGRRALMTLAGRGIGPTTASRILTPGAVDDRHRLLRAIAEAEKTYAQTRQFWD